MSNGVITINQKREHTAIKLAEQGVLSFNERMIAAQTSLKVIDATDGQLIEVISAAVEKALFDLGYRNYTDDEVDLMKFSLMRDVRFNLHFLHLGDIELAIEKGARGHFGEVKGISPIGLLGWCVAYNGSYEHKEALRIHHLEQVAEPVKPSPAEIMANNIELLKRAWHKFKEEGKYDDHGNLIYNTLIRLKLVPFTQERKDKMLEQAKQDLLAYYAPEKAVGNPGKRSEYTHKTQAIKDGLMEKAIISQAKKIGLHTYFTELRDMGEEIENLINQTNES